MRSPGTKPTTVLFTITALAAAVAVAAAGGGAAEQQPPAGWAKDVVLSLNLTQNTFSNWQAGGTGSVAWSGKVTGAFDHQRRQDIWTHDVVLEYGMVKQEGQETRKSVDAVSYETVYTRKVHYLDEPYVSASVATQFALGRDYSAEGVDANAPNSDFPATSRFADPLYLGQGVGVGRRLNPYLETRFGFSIREVVTDRVRRYACRREERDTITDEEQRDRLCDPTLVDTGVEWISSYDRTFQEKTRYKSDLRLYYSVERSDEVNLIWKHELTAKLLRFLDFNLALDLLFDNKVSDRLQVKQLMGIGVSFDVL